MLELFRKLKVNQFSKARTLLFSLLQMNYKERNLALLVLKDSKEFRITSKCKSYLQVSPRLSFLPEWLSFLSECYEPMVELWKCHLSLPLTPWYWIWLPTPPRKKRCQASGRDTHCLTQSPCSQSLSILFNSRKIFSHINISFLFLVGKRYTCGWKLTALS